MYEKLFSETNYGRTQWAKWLRLHGAAHESLFQGFASLLDVGCGRSPLAALAAKAFGIGKLTVCDISPTAIGEQITEHGIDARVVDIRAPLPFDDDSYELVTCFGVLEHLLEDEILRASAELCRVATRRIIIYIGSNSSKYEDSEELHLTQQPVEWWQRMLTKVSGAKVEIRKCFKYSYNGRDGMQERLLVDLDGSLHGG
jgi:SAM-dependent methyltransferase